MTPAEWHASTDPAAMLAFAADRLSDRKLRLFLVGCCRRRWELFADGRCRAAVSLAERAADGRASRGELHRAAVLAREAGEEAAWDSNRAGGYVAAEVAWAVTDPTADLRQVTGGRANGGRVLAAVMADLLTDRAAGERTTQARLLRCVAGDPSVFTVFDPAWQTAAVRGLAMAAYSERAFDRLPILADALEEAGCEDEAVLGHGRGNGPHARGCWVVDGLLGLG